MAPNIADPSYKPNHHKPAYHFKPRCMFQNDWIGNVQAILQMKHNFASFLSFQEVLYCICLTTVLSAWFPKREKKQINRDSLDEQPMHVQPHWMNAKTVHA